MSKEARERVWEHSKIHGSAKVLLLWLGERADKDGICWPGMSDLKSKTGLSTRSIQSHLKTLEIGGEIFTPTSFGRGNYPIYFVSVGLPETHITGVLTSHEKLEERGLVMTPELARKTASEIISRQGKGVEKAQDNATFRRGEKAQDSALKGAGFGIEKAQDSSVKGAVSCIPYIEEPSYEPSIEPTEKKHAVKSPSDWLEMSKADDCAALAEICKIDLQWGVHSQMQSIRDNLPQLRGMGATPDTLRQFLEWWQKNDWRGKKGEAPKAYQVRETWKQFADHGTNKPRKNNSGKGSAGISDFSDGLVSKRVDKTAQAAAA